MTKRLSNHEAKLQADLGQITDDFLLEGGKIEVLVCLLKEEADYAPERQKKLLER